MCLIFSLTKIFFLYCVIIIPLIILFVILDYDSVRFVLSRRGKPQLLYKGYLYNSDSTANGRTYWRCSETRRGSCMARLVSTNNTVYEKQPIHDHEPNMSRVEGKRLLETVSYKEYINYFTTGKIKLPQEWTATQT